MNTHHVDGDGRGLRVLQVVDNPYLGGISRYAITIAKALRADGRVRVDVATFPGKTDDRGLFRLAEEAGLSVMEIPMGGRFDIGAVGRIRDLVRNGAYDVIHVHNYRAATLVALARLDTPVAHTCHGPIVRPSVKLRVWQSLNISAMRRSAVVIACSESVGVWLMRKRVSRDNLVVIPNAAEGPQSVKDAPPDESLRLLYAGRLVAGKGLERLIHAVKRRDGIHLTIAGEGPLRPLAERSAGAKIDYLGPVSDVGPLYEGCDAVVLLSEQEAMPLTLIEAAAYGRPVVATNVGGVSEVVVDGETGLLVPPRDDHALSEAFSILSDPQSRHTMGQRARTRWEHSFSPQAFAERLRHAYLRASMVRM